uniref:G domain-containing protein n=1 Tax=Strongyloides stercoralis TaxID=6248 RepID=A0A0K0EQY4_STRER
MCKSNKTYKESAASKRGKEAKKCISSKKSVLNMESIKATKTDKKISIKQDVLNLNINPHVYGALKSIPIFYQKCVVPLEQFYPINSITDTLPWTDTEITGKPTILIIGEKGTGKTSLINFFIEPDCKSSQPPNSTSKITFFQYGNENGELLNMSQKNESNFQFKQILKFVENMDNIFTIVNSTSKFLKYVNLIDTPGYETSYENTKCMDNYTAMYKYLFQRVDRIIVTFDHKKINEASKVLLKDLSNYLDKTIFVINKLEEVKQTDELIKKREEILWTISNELNIEKPPKIYLGSYNSTPIELNPISELFLKDMDEINENIKQLHIQYIITRLKCIEDYCITIYIYSAFLNTFTDIIKKHYFVEKCTDVNQIENGIRLTLKCIPKNEIIEKKFGEFSIFLKKKSCLLNKELKSCDKYKLKELQEFIEISFKNIFDSGKEECEKLSKESEFVLPVRKAIKKDNKKSEYKKIEVDKSKENLKNQYEKDKKKDNEIIRKLEAENKALEIEKKLREEEIKIKNELEEKKKRENYLKEKLESEIRLKLQLEMQSKAEAEKAKKADEEKHLADQERIRKLEEEKRLRELKDEKSLIKKGTNNNPVIVVVKGNNDNNNSVSRSHKSSKSHGSRSDKSEKTNKTNEGFQITLV